LSKNVPDATAIGISAPGGARYRFGADAAKKNLQTIKNPATSAGRIRPSSESLFPRDSKTDVLEARFLSIRY
jgi:hypothetical protein